VILSFSDDLVFHFRIKNLVKLQSGEVCYVIFLVTCLLTSYPLVHCT